MSTYTTFFPSGGGGGSLPIFVFTTSGTWTVDRDGTVAVHVIGGGGGGGRWCQDQCGRASGGGAGGYALKEISVTSGQTYAASVGLGGARLHNVELVYSGATCCCCGFAGSASCFYGNGVILCAAGGSPGNGATGSNTSFAGGPGGTACGGDINVTGGCGGFVCNANCSWVTSGGGATGVWGCGYNGGCAWAQGNTSCVAGGGGGVGGQGAWTRHSETGDANGGGGGSGGPGGGWDPANTCFCPQQCGRFESGGPAGFKPYAFSKYWKFLPILWGAGATAGYRNFCTISKDFSTFTELGGGAAGCSGLPGGAFAGGGGSAMTDYMSGGDGGFGGGGGGGASSRNVAGGGGQGVIFIEYLS